MLLLLLLLLVLVPPVAAAGEGGACLQEGVNNRDNNSHGLDTVYGALSSPVFVYSFAHIPTLPARPK